MDKQKCKKDTKQDVETLRKRFFCDVEPHLYEEVDLMLFRKDDAYCERFLAHHQGDIDKALNMVKEAFKWRKDFIVKGITEDSIPIELRKAGILTKINYDKKGNPIILLNLKLHRRESRMVHEFKRGIIFTVEKSLSLSPNKALTFMFDCDEACYANFDLEMAMFIMTIFLKYYPSSLENVLVYAMPWIYNAVWKVFKPLIPRHHRRLIAFVNQETIKNYIDEKFLPTRMGGKDTTVFKYEPGQWD